MKKQKNDFLPTGQAKRFFNDVLDWIGIYLLALLLGITNISTFYLIVILYYTIFESIYSKTLAKFITRTKVITKNGEKPDAQTIFIRTLIRFVPFNALSFLFSAHPRGWHDKCSVTIVIDDVKK